MRALWVCFFAFSSLGCGSEDDGGGGGGAGPGGSCDTAGTSPAAYECRVLEIANQHRAAGASCGGKSMPAVGKLEMHSTLRKSARAHAADMAAKGYFAHESLDGKSPFERMSDAGYDWQTAGENIAGGSPTPEGSMDQWMNSPGHCTNIMKSDFIHLGVGYVMQDGSPLTHYWVQNFGTPQ